MLSRPIHLPLLECGLGECEEAVESDEEKGEGTGSLAFSSVKHS